MKDVYALFILLASLTGIILMAVYVEERKKSPVVEIRNEHLVFSADNCRVYQVVIQNEHGTEIVYVTTTDPNKTGRQSAYPTCRVTK